MGENIFSGVIDDAKWLLIQHFMEKYGIYFKGLKSGDKVQLTITTPKAVIELAGRITPKEDTGARIQELLDNMK